MVDVFGMRCSVMVSSIAQTAVITKDDILCGKPTIQLHVCMLGLVFFILKHTNDQYNLIVQSCTYLPTIAQ